MNNVVCGAVPHEGNRLFLVFSIFANDPSYGKIKRCMQRSMERQESKAKCSYTTKEVIAWHREQISIKS